MATPFDFASLYPTLLLRPTYGAEGPRPVPWKWEHHTDFDGDEGMIMPWGLTPRRVRCYGDDAIVKWPRTRGIKRAFASTVRPLDAAPARGPPRKQRR